MDLKEKIHQLLSARRVACIATITEDGRPWVRYVVPRPDEDLNLRFATHRGSRKVGQIQKNAEVHLTTGVANLETARHYVQVEGRAEILTDAQAKTDHWNDHLKTYFFGPDDPDYCVVLVRPYRIEYMSMTARDPEVWTPI